MVFTSIIKDEHPRIYTISCSKSQAKCRKPRNMCDQTRFGEDCDSEPSKKYNQGNQGVIRWGELFLCFSNAQKWLYWMVYWRRLVCSSALGWSAKDWASIQSCLSQSISGIYPLQLPGWPDLQFQFKQQNLSSGLTRSYPQKKVYHSVIKHGHHKWRFHGEIMKK